MHASRAQALFQIPPLEMAESPSSWLTRAALSQGASLKELMKFLDLPRGGDPDLIFTRDAVRRIAMLCGMKVDDFAVIRTMMTGLMRVDRSGKTYLLWHERKPKYRYCPVCLHEQRTKYFPLHWRFKAWRWCPEHMCMLEKTCPHCGAAVTLPEDMYKAGPDKEGVAYLDRCLQCGELLSSLHQVAKGVLNSTVLTPWEKVLLDNGRALLAALYRREIWIEDQRFGFSVRGVRRIEKQGLLPHDHFGLESAEIGRRAEVLLKISDEI